MTHQLLHLPRAILSTALQLLPGWKIRLYLTGTTTPTPAYETSALDPMAVHTQPIVADAGGVLDEVYLDPSIVYKCSVYNAANVLQYTVDPVNDQILSQSIIGALLYPRTDEESAAVVTPENYGYPPGDEARQSPDKTGVADSHDAILASDSAYWGNYFSVPGTYSSAPLTLTGSITGLGWTNNVSAPPDVQLVKRSNGTQFVLAGEDAQISQIDLAGAKASGKTGDGLQLAATRQLLNCVSVHDQGSDGIRIGGVGATGTFNANCWLALRPISVSNDSDGCLVHHSGGTVTGTYANGTPDVNAGLMLGSDFRSNGATGLTVQNAIDNTFIGLVTNSNTGKGLVLKADSQGNKFFGVYSEGNNGSGGNRGDEIDIESGAHENVIIGLRSNQTAGGGLKDVNTAGKNLLIHYDAGVGSWVYRAKFALWNPFEDGSTTADFEAWCGTVPVNAYIVKASIGGTTGGVWTLATKIDGGAMTDHVVVNQTGDAIFKNQTNGTLFGGKTTFDTTTTGTTLDGTAGRINIVNSGAGTKTVAAFYDASGVAGSISTNGSGATAYNTSSARHLKQDIEDAPDQGSVIDAIQIRQFAFKAAPDVKVIGVIADELQQVVPSAATSEMVDYSKLVPLLIAEIQSLRARVAALET